MSENVTVVVLPRNVSEAFKRLVFDFVDVVIDVIDGKVVPKKIRSGRLDDAKASVINLLTQADEERREICASESHQEVRITMQGFDDPDDSDAATMWIKVQDTLLPALPLPFAVANDAVFWERLERSIRAAYQAGHAAGEKAGKDKFNDLIKWARD